MEFLLFPLTILVLTTIHESGHVGTAKVLGLRITGIGLTMKPIPHPYVSINWSGSRPRVLAFFFAGVTLTALQFSLLLGNHFFNQPIVYVAFCAQLILETNPFYSDFTLAFRFMVYPRRTEYSYSLLWYVHLSLWAALIILLLSRRFLYGALF